MPTTLRREGAALQPSTVQYLKPPPTFRPPCHFFMQQKWPHPQVLHRHTFLTAALTTPRVTLNKAVKGGHLLGTATLMLLSWQVFSTGYIYMETGFVLGPKAARVYYPQIKPVLSPVTMISRHLATPTRGLQGGCQPPYF